MFQIMISMMIKKKERKKKCKYFQIFNIVTLFDQIIFL